MRHAETPVWAATVATATAAPPRRATAKRGAPRGASRTGGVRRGHWRARSDGALLCVKRGMPSLNLLQEHTISIKF
jgi:hypothetical protein